MTLTPHSVAEVAEAVRAAAARGRTVSCAPGGGDIHLDLCALRQVRFYEPGDLTLGVEAGATPAAIEPLLAAQRQWLPLDAPRARATPLGALLAGHGAGPLRHGYGSVRDFTLGIEFVSAAGEIIHGGGRVVKNVAGYDLMKLLIGSRGRLGIITAANFKVFPLPAQLETMVLTVDWDGIEPLRRALLHGPLRPLAVEMHWRCLERLPSPAVLVRYAGSEAVRARYRAELAALGAPARVWARDEEAALWAQCNDWPRTTDARMSFPAAEAVEALRKMHPEAVLGRLGLGVYRVRGAPAAAAPPPPDDAGLNAALTAALDPAGVFAARVSGGDAP